ncbi:unnamed protein product [Amoebophrya sp. A120]|nr:unnamed protein product [Amoebophrya sp. A120]|eukprot:GSA120T00007003001.1
MLSEEDVNAMPAWSVVYMEQHQQMTLRVVVSQLLGASGTKAFFTGAVPPKTLAPRKDERILTELRDARGTLLKTEKSMMSMQQSVAKNPHKNIKQVVKHNEVFDAATASPPLVEASFVISQPRKLPSPIRLNQRPAAEAPADTWENKLIPDIRGRHFFSPRMSRRYLHLGTRFIV